MNFLLYLCFGCILICVLFEGEMCQRWPKGPQLEPVGDNIFSWFLLQATETFLSGI